MIAVSSNQGMPRDTTRTIAQPMCSISPGLTQLAHSTQQPGTSTPGTWHSLPTNLFHRKHSLTCSPSTSLVHHLGEDRCPQNRAGAGDYGVKCSLVLSEVSLQALKRHALHTEKEAIDPASRNGLYPV